MRQETRRHPLLLIAAVGVPLLLGALLLGLLWSDGKALAQEQGAPPAPNPSPAGQGIAPPPAGTGGQAARGPIVPEPPVVPKVTEAPVPDWIAALMEGGPVGEADGVVLAQSVNAGVGGSTWAYNSDLITYTLTITNGSAASITINDLVDVLPLDALEQITCVGTPASVTCSYPGTTIRIPDPIDLTAGITITIPRRVDWIFGPSGLVLSSGGVLSLRFEGRVIGQAEGTRFTNRTFLRYDGTKQLAGAPLTLPARTKFTRTGQPAISQAASWQSQDVGGTFSTDWGDFDRDGLLDLAIGSTAGAAVYRNDNGRLVRFWGSNRYTLGVRWIDVDGDRTLELVAVGDSAGPPGAEQGVNYIYKPNAAGDGFDLMHQFTSRYPLLRVEAVAPGLGPSGLPDLLATRNSLEVDPTCGSVLHFANPGNGLYVEVGSNGSCVLLWGASPMQPTAAIAVGDIDNDGLPEVLADWFPGYVVAGDLLLDGAQPSIYLSSVLLVPFMAYDFAFGDYDGDGLLDLAAAFPMPGRATVYRNQGGGSFLETGSFPVSRFGAPQAVRWGDFNGDGRLDLAVGDSPQVVHLNSGGEPAGWDDVLSLGAQVPGQVWSAGVADATGSGALEVAFGNRYAASMLYSSFSVPLARALTPVVTSPGDTWAASSVAWGHVAGDPLPDLLYGGGLGGQSLGARLFVNTGGTFPPGEPDEQLAASGFGPHRVAFADHDGTGRLSVAVGTGSGIQIYTNGVWTAPAYTLPDAGYDIAWGDVDGDGRLDLLAGTQDGVAMYRRLPGAGQLQRTWSAAGPAQALVDWGDYDGDGRLDIAAISPSLASEQPLYLYRNNPDGTFTRVMGSASQSLRATALAWADFDGDGDVDLAAGSYLTSTVILENMGGWPEGTFVARPLLDASASFGGTVTDLAWGDHDNDGDLDLAMSTDQGVKVFTNLRGRLVCLWESDRVAVPGQPSGVEYHATGVAWGDADGDGDLDLAISHQTPNGPTYFHPNGYFINRLNEPVGPAASLAGLQKLMPLPDNPPFVSVRRPGQTDVAYLRSSAEILGTPQHPTVTVTFRSSDPGAARNSLDYASEAEATESLDFVFQYSLDGGATYTTTTHWTSPPYTPTARLDQPREIWWRPDLDAAIGDDARFRVIVTRNAGASPVQSITGSAVSPPFRVRGTTCVWPRDPEIVIEPLTPGPGVPANTFRLRALIAEGSGAMSYQWDLGDGSAPVYGPMFEYTYERLGRWTIRVVITSEPCPVAWSVSAETPLLQGMDRFIYLPMVGR